MGIAANSSIPVEGIWTLAGGADAIGVAGLAGAGVAAGVVGAVAADD